MVVGDASDATVGEEAELNMEDAAQSSADEAAGGEASGHLSHEPMAPPQTASLSRQVQQLVEPYLTFIITNDPCTITLPLTEA